MTNINVPNPDPPPIAPESAPPAAWVVSLSAGDDVPGRLGDARAIADHAGQAGHAGHWRVAVLAVGREPDFDAGLWIRQGADEVHCVAVESPGVEAALEAAGALWRDRPPRLVLAGADRWGRSWAARLAARRQWPLVSPALLVQRRNGRLIATGLDASGRRAQRCELPEDRPAIVALRPGVAQAGPADAARQGTVHRTRAAGGPSRVRSVERLPADPEVADIRHLPKLIAGGRGVGGREGFDRLRRVAERLGAGVAASRMAVDLGWIEHERQVGQTGKTVRPDLYLACGISGASHHLEGMADSRHIIAVNTDPDAPLLKHAHLALVGDLHRVLEQLERELEGTA